MFRVLNPERFIYFPLLVERIVYIGRTRVIWLPRDNDEYLLTLHLYSYPSPKKYVDIYLPPPSKSRTCTSSYVSRNGNGPLHTQPAQRLNTLEEDSSDELEYLTWQEKAKT